AQALHARILAALIERDADLSQLVHHAAHAHDEAALLEYAPRAAERAASAGAHREAVAHLATALRHAATLNAPERAWLFERHAAGCNMTNQVAESIASAEAALPMRRRRRACTCCSRSSTGRRATSTASTPRWPPPSGCSSHCRPGRSWPWPTAAGRATP